MFHPCHQQVAWKQSILLFINFPLLAVSWEPWKCWDCHSKQDQHGSTHDAWHVPDHTLQTLHFRGGSMLKSWPLSTRTPQRWPWIPNWEPNNSTYGTQSLAPGDFDKKYRLMIRLLKNSEITGSIAAWTSRICTCKISRGMVATWRTPGNPWRHGPGRSRDLCHWAISNCPGTEPEPYGSSTTATRKGSDVVPKQRHVWPSAAQFFQFLITFPQVAELLGFQVQVIPSPNICVYIIKRYI